MQEIGNLCSCDIILCSKIIIVIIESDFKRISDGIVERGAGYGIGVSGKFLN